MLASENTSRLCIRFDLRFKQTDHGFPCCMPPQFLPELSQCAELPNVQISSVTPTMAQTKKIRWSICQRQNANQINGLQQAAGTITTLSQTRTITAAEIISAGITCSWPLGQAAGTPASLTLQRSTRHRAPRPLAATACAAPSDLPKSSVALRLALLGAWTYQTRYRSCCCTKGPDVASHGPARCQTGTWEEGYLPYPRHGCPAGAWGKGRHCS